MTTRPCFAGVLAAGALLGFASSTAGQQPDRPVLSVLEYNYAKIPSAQLTEATEIVTRMYADAGIDIRWLDPLEDHRFVVSPTSNSLGTFTVQMLMRAHGPLGWDVRPEWIMGRAFPSSESGGTLWVLYDQVKRTARAYHRPIADILAIAMAHEVGHLLLPYPSHTATGVMRAAWYGSDLKSGVNFSEAFTPTQGSAMRAKVSGCCVAVKRVGDGPDR